MIKRDPQTRSGRGRREKTAAEHGAGGSRQKKRFKKAAGLITSLLALTASAFMYPAFNYMPAAGAAVILLLAVRLVLRGRELKACEAVLSAIAAACVAAATVSAAHHMARTAFVTAATVISLSLLIIPAAVNMKNGRRDAADVTACAFGTAFFCLVILPLFVCAVCPDAAVRLMQTALEPYPEDPETTVEVSGGRTLYRDVTYESGYPNSTYTVYSVKDSGGVFFYIHGGGLVWGDKEETRQNIYLNSLTGAGYSVVTVDYALAPDHRFPDQLFQVNDALAFFIGHAGEYGLDSDRIIVGGDSAGGMLAGLLAAVNTDPSYAGKVGITPATSGTGVSLKGFVSIAGLVDAPRFGRTGSVFSDWFYDTMARCAFGRADYATDKSFAELSSVLENITASFPPSFVSDGNARTFTDQGKDLIAKLDGYGIPNGGNFPPRSLARLTHTWELDTSTEQGRISFEKTVAFMDEFMR